MRRRLIGLFSAFAASTAISQAPMRVGVIGCDTSHTTAFANILHSPKATGDLAGFRVTVAFPGGSKDVPSSIDRVAGYVAELKNKHQVKIVESIPELVREVDVVLLESVDGRPHFAQAIPVLEARKPMFVDKPAAGTLADVIRLYDLAKRTGTPIWSSSGLRFAPGIAAARGEGKFGKVLGCFAYSPCHLEPHHPDFYWYGIHGVETLYTIMGPGCETVARASTPDCDIATGVWKDGRVGVFRGYRNGKLDYGATVFGTNGNGQTGGFGGYEPLIAEVCKFFRTKRPPVNAEETIELYAFMSAADESKKRGGAPVAIADVLRQAKEEASKPR
jgi:predicted dehydrogenase